MEREELLAFLYKARSFFERAEELRNQHNRLIQTYKAEILYAKPKEYIVYRPNKIDAKNMKEWKKWRGVSGFFKTFGVWCFLMFSLIRWVLMHQRSSDVARADSELAV